MKNKKTQEKRQDASETGKVVAESAEVEAAERTEQAAKEADAASEDAVQGGETAAGGDGEAGGREEDSDPAAKIAVLETRIAELNDQYLRKAADFENFRKRMNNEKQSAIEYANTSLLLDIIPVMDDFERALKAAESAQKTEADFNALLEGITMIEKRLATQLENKWGLKRYDSVGQPFDPEKHEAMLMEKAAELTEPVVREEFMKGYTLKDRVIRSAKVKVLMPE